MKVLVLGGGQIATAVMKAAPARIEVVARARAQLDIAEPVAVMKTFAQLKPDWVVNAAAYTAVDLAEDNRSQAKAVNDAAVASLAKAAAGAESRLLHLSTDFVFDGTSSRAYLPNDATNPLSVYGATKLAGERHVLADKNGIVLRTSWVYASTGKNFVLTMLKLMREREQLKVVCDQIGSPHGPQARLAPFGGSFRRHGRAVFTIGPTSGWPVGTISRWRFKKRLASEIYCRALFQSCRFPAPSIRPAPDGRRSAC